MASTLLWGPKNMATQRRNGGDAIGWSSFVVRCSRRRRSRVRLALAVGGRPGLHVASWGGRLATVRVHRGHLRLVQVDVRLQVVVDQPHREPLAGPRVLHETIVQL